MTSTPHTPTSLAEALRLLEAERAQAQADRLDAVARLAGSAAHDYNNLLSVINGYCEMLAPELAGQPDIADQVAEIHKAGKKAIELSRLLLSFGGRQAFQPRVVDLNEIVRAQHEHLIEVLAPSAAALRVETTEAPCQVQTDPEQFKQVLHHLCTNARDAVAGAPDATVIVRTELRRPERTVALSIADNGAGIDEAARGKIFEPFFSTKPTGKGVGLGLSVVHGIVTRSGGTVTARNGENAGAIFEIILPAAELGGGSHAQ
ncbi:hypothetical protein AXK11_01660 [Cephaloticoccus primus]|uniref:histidine kinase n=1 Tax=Cephaloticoccus primus TaxID=1548207 RepID=A0A139STI7_9BACT|nr:ATP-binding protein [Cephaloticoccus primus]KXU37886.1 hypothetical protein AXK11_01660 [Cephaloticoccus primus]